MDGFQPSPAMAVGLGIWDQLVRPERKMEAMAKVQLAGISIRKKQCKNTTVTATAFGLVMNVQSCHRFSAALTASVEYVAMGR